MEVIHHGQLPRQPFRRPKDTNEVSYLWVNLSLCSVLSGEKSTTSVCDRINSRDARGRQRRGPHDVFIIYLSDDSDEDEQNGSHEVQHEIKIQESKSN
ncbi:hypothetical protein Pcinc_020444 [Petrolisthes cinctipes]|uniref:Uncharacterized protein n=1 Tax=Petrolisthes cinctipes TaxID=88211 RepID=A0AAE1FJ59_PETCI|nr:hypothetical protein Pcinc_020444 [Petrolisthes cinctipes]